MIECTGIEILAYGGGLVQENDAMAMISKSIYASLALEKCVFHMNLSLKRQF